MICCLCGEPIDPVDVIVRLTMHRLMSIPAVRKQYFAQIPLEDGTMEKIAHATCPAMFGAPLALIGADRRPDV